MKGPGDSVPLGNERGLPIAHPLHDGRRGPRHERLEAQPRLGGGQFPRGVGERLPELLDLGLAIAVRHEDVHAGVAEHARQHVGIRGDVVGEAERLEAGQRHDVRFAGAQHGLLGRRGAFDRGRDPRRRLHAALGPRRADGRHHALHQADVGRDALVGSTGHDGRERGPRDRVAVAGPPRQLLPDLLGDERDNRVQQAHHRVVHLQQHRHRRVPLGAARLQVRLDDLDVPVRVLVPEEVIEAVGGGVEPVAPEPRVHFPDDLVQPVQDPAVDRRQVSRRRHRRPLRQFADRHQHEARRVPDLVDELAVPLHPLLREDDVHAGRRHGRQREPERVGADVVHDLERVDDVAARLAHLLPVLVAHEAGDVDLAERHVAHELRGPS